MDAKLPGVMPVSLSRISNNRIFTDAVLLPSVHVVVDDDGDEGSCVHSPLQAQQDSLNEHSVDRMPSSPLLGQSESCFHRFLLLCYTALGLGVFVILYCLVRTAPTSRDPDTGAVVPYSFLFFLYCFMGGIIAGLAHLVVTPIDVLKCRVQVGEYDSIKDGVHRIYMEEARGSWVRAAPLLFRGWLPTLWGYCIQGALKFSLYELLKYLLIIRPQASALLLVSGSAAPVAVVRGSSNSLSAPLAAPLPHYSSGVVQLLVFLFSSCIAEVVADLGLAPWEAVKIRMQTSSSFPSQLRRALPLVWNSEGLYGFYKGLVPLWCRQVPYTMVKFTSFEKFVVLIQGAMNMLMRRGSDTTTVAPPPGATERLFVSLAAGVIAGIFCAIVSHPADTVLSKLNQRGSAVASGTVIVVATTANSPGSPKTGVASKVTVPSNASGVTHQPSLRAQLRDLGWCGVWKGLGPRLLMVSCLTAMQWVCYDSFKVFVGLPTSGTTVKR